MVRKIAFASSLVFSLPSPSLSQPIWTETFDSGVGRLQDTTGAGASRFVWQQDTQSLSSTFFRYHSSDQRYARLGSEFDASRSILGFSAVVTPLSGDGQSVRANGNIGFLHSSFDNAHNIIAVRFSQWTELGGGRIFRIAGYYASGNEIDPRGDAPFVPFDFGVPYFIDAILDGPRRIFSVRIHQGENAAGPLLGTLIREIDANETLSVDALGVSNTTGGGGDRTFQARIDDFSLTATDVITDCNKNGTLDLFDIEDGTSHDCNGNGVPDECEVSGQGLVQFHLVTSVHPPGNPAPGEWGPVLAFGKIGLGPLNVMPSIPDGQVHDPLGLAFNNDGELFVGNRHGNSGEGSISRFGRDTNENFVPHGMIQGNELSRVHQIAFSPTGELFCANFHGGIPRFLLDAEGNAVANGVIAHPAPIHGVAVSQSGELFVTDTGTTIWRYRFDDNTKEPISNGSFSVEGSSYLTFARFNASGQLFVTDVQAGRVFRCDLEDPSNPVCEAVAIVPSPVGVAFAPNGEMFVSARNPHGIYRYSFDHRGGASRIEFVPVSGPLGDIAILPVSTDNDCNENDILDECEIRDGMTLDCNSNGIPDECERSVLWVSEFHAVERDRSIINRGALGYSGVAAMAEAAGAINIEVDDATPITEDLLGPHALVVFGLSETGDPLTQSEMLAVKEYATKGGKLLVLSGGFSNAGAYANSLGTAFGVTFDSGPSGGNGDATSFIADVITRNIGSLYFDGPNYLTVHEPAILLGSYGTRGTLARSGAAVFWADDWAFMNATLGRGDNRQFVRNLFCLAGLNVEGQCEHEAVTNADCNENGIPDECEIRDAKASDCNLNRIPDECEGFACEDDNPCTQDACEAGIGCRHVPIVSACDDSDSCTRNDACDGLGVCAGERYLLLYGDIDPPSGNEVVDVDDIVYVLQAFGGLVDPAPADLWPCQPFGDGNVDVDDLLAILSGFARNSLCPDPCPRDPEPDCNANGIADSVDILFGGSLDCNVNRIPDECDGLAANDIGAVNLASLVGFAAVRECMAGPSNSITPSHTNCVAFCEQAFDEDQDGDIDLHDVAGYFNMFGAQLRRD